YAPRPLHLPPLVGHPQPSPAPQRLAEQEEVARPLPLVLAVQPPHSPRLCLHRFPHLADELLARLVHADHGEAGIVGQLVVLQDVLHPPDELGFGPRWDAPHLHQMGFQFVFLSVCRTVSGATRSIYPNSTNLVASNRTVHRRRPAGGWLHASAIRWASCSPSSLRCRCRDLGRRVNTAAKPCSTRVCGTR